MKTVGGYDLDKHARREGEPSRRPCSTCGKRKAIEQFARAVGYSGNRRKQCRECRNAHMRTNYVRKKGG